ncbi:uncharacterized protein LOC132474099 isoform X2 [Gadus macrocephalus]|uniref:uncharacterized protein LOC132474099 isoform X2 n=1 Tax=Gadus macrocephalus TaxID=80720 RepID=UPI0028CB8106|nr:uncharacterized protein LOC132474099 isoform X2 [Gadus macrocephalus]
MASNGERYAQLYGRNSDWLVTQRRIANHTFGPLDQATTFLKTLLGTAAYWRVKTLRLHDLPELEKTFAERNANGRLELAVQRGKREGATFFSGEHFFLHFKGSCLPPRRPPRPSPVSCGASHASRPGPAAPSCTARPTPPMVRMTRSKTFQAYLPSCHRTYSCIHCRAHLANHDELISKSFQGSQGRAYLFNSVVNVGCGPAEERVLLTGLHAVADIYCENCKTTLGWKYG